MTDELAALIARRFIQRRDVKAIQFANGNYAPDRELKNPGAFLPLGFKKSHLMDHLAGTQTYGHYLIDSDDLCRVFAFDIDLEQKGSWVHMPQVGIDIDDDTDEASVMELMSAEDCNPRELWLDRRAVDARAWFKLQMKQLAGKFANVIHTEMGLDCAVAYSGSKGVHVYGFTGPIPAAQVREAAEIAMELTGEFELSRGKNFFRHKNDDPFMGYPSFSVEIYPKQSSLDGKDLGNLMRLPLGRNKKSSDPTFFLDMTVPVGVFKPHSDPVKLLETGNPYV